MERLRAAVTWSRNAESALSVLVADAVVVVPMLLATRFFFPDRAESSRDQGSKDMNNHGT